ncbi:MAG: SH3 domain-containing protein [Anaerolineae bacterium]|nr:SH3 domain-containing protein [Anaerolineae bacterium]
MVSRRFPKVLTIFVGLLLLVILPQVAAQDTETCSALVQQALEEIGPNCADLPRNSACYGYNNVGATFFEPVADDFFTKPSDQSQITEIESLQTAPLDEEANVWGVAVMSIQANIPDTLPGQAVRFILLGDVAIDNDVDPTTVAEIVDPIPVSVLTNANIRSGPTRNSNVVGGARVGSELVADGINNAGDWVRVTFGDAAVGWISRELVSAQGDLDTLPVVDAVPRTPMQAFHLRTGLGETTCEEAASLLVVQGPQNVKIDITVNGVDVQLGSTVFFQTTENSLKLGTLDGSARIGNFVIPAGYVAEAPLDEEGNVDGSFGQFRNLTQSELDALQILENISPDVLNYAVNVPNRPPPPRPTDAPSSGPTPETVTTPVSGNADCGGFRASSPLDGLSFGLNTFFWDPAPGATSYRLTIVGYGSIETTNLNVQYDLYNAGINYQMSWYVEALVNGQVACTSQTVTVPREASPPPFGASWQCGPGADQVTVYFQNAPPGTSSVTINIYSLQISDTRPVPPYSGSATYSPFYGGGGVVVANPSGQAIGLPDISCRGTQDS